MGSDPDSTPKYMLMKPYVLNKRTKKYINADS